MLDYMPHLYLLLSRAWKSNLMAEEKRSASNNVKPKKIIKTKQNVISECKYVRECVWHMHEL